VFKQTSLKIAFRMNNIMEIAMFHRAFFNSIIDKHQHMLHGETLKFVNVQQAKPYNIYKITKLKLLKHMLVFINIMESLLKKEILLLKNFHHQVFKT